MHSAHRNPSDLSLSSLSSPMAFLCLYSGPGPAFFSDLVSPSSLATYSSLALLSTKHTQFVPASGPLLSFSSVPGQAFHAALSFSSFRSRLQSHLRQRPSLKASLSPSTLFYCLHCTYHNSEVKVQSILITRGSSIQLLQTLN